MCSRPESRSPGRLHGASFRPSPRGWFSPLSGVSSSICGRRCRIPRVRGAIDASTARTRCSPYAASSIPIALAKSHRSRRRHAGRFVPFLRDGTLSLGPRRKAIGPSGGRSHFHASGASSSMSMRNSLNPPITPRGGDRAAVPALRSPPDAACGGWAGVGVAPPAAAILAAPSTLRATPDRRISERLPLRPASAPAPSPRSAPCCRPAVPRSA